MSVTTDFGFANETASTNTLSLTALDITSNYALVADEPDKCVLSNVTCPIDEPEVLTYGARNITSVSSSISNQNPPKVKGGIQYQIKLEELLRTTSSTDASFVVDDPIVATVTIRHSKSGNITGTKIDEVWGRLNSAIVKKDGTTRFSDLMRSALKPTED